MDIQIGIWPNMSIENEPVVYYMGRKLQFYKENQLTNYLL